MDVLENLHFWINFENFESVILIRKVLLDSGIYQGDLKRGVPHGEVGVDSIIGVLA